MVEQMRTAGLHTFDAVIVLDTDISDQTVAGSDVTGSELGFVQQPGDAVALLQHSSGTTGLKKGVALSFDAISQHAISYGKTLELSGDDVIVSWLPLYHDMGLMACFITPSFHAIKTVQMSAFDWLNRPNSLFTKIKEHEGTLCWLPNFAFEHLTNTLARHAGKFDLGSMRAFINCSEPCKASTFDRFSEAFSPASVQPDMLKNCYAMAEVVFGVSQVSMTDSVSRLSIDGRNLNIGEQVIESSNEAHATELIDCGIALEGVQIQIVDADRIPLSEGVIGEIAISSNFLFTGYNKDADRTAKSLNEGIYHSSDLGFQWNQRLYVLGRLDDLIIINGRNLFAHEIELLTGQIAGVKAGRVVALPHSDTKAGSDVLVIMAERDNNSSTSDESIINSIITRLQSELDIVPRDIKLVDPGTLVKTSSGKMSRKENYNVFIAARDTEILRRAS
jgi:acyl-CoA synthetase (AMP-forming)/AMP-acid ligase II